MARPIATNRRGMRSRIMPVGCRFDRRSATGRSIRHRKVHGSGGLPTPGAGDEGEGRRELVRRAAPGRIRGTHDWYWRWPLTQSVAPMTLKLLILLTYLRISVAMCRVGRRIHAIQARKVRRGLQP